MTNMDLSIINNVSPQVYEKLCQLAETGKWFDGKAMTTEQHELVQQAVLAYQAKVERSGQHMTIDNTGEIVQQSKQQLRQALQKQSENEIIRVKNDDL